MTADFRLLPMLPPAMDYHRLGWSVIPTSNKKPNGKWRQYQRERPDESTLRQWFGDTDNGNRGIGVVCGGVSGGLLVRDFDHCDAYANWKRRHPALARVLPTVRTKRGYHVYARCEGYLRSPHGGFVRSFDDGELRGDGHIVIAPPSIHPGSGLPYRWLISPTEPPPVVSLEVFDTTPQSGPVTHDMLCYKFEGLDATVVEAIIATLPSGPGERNRRLFDFARLLRGMERFSSATADDLLRPLRQWFDAALPVIRTKDFETTRREFATAWPQVKLPSGGSILAALAIAKESPLPREAEQFRIPELRLLVGLCRELQHQHRGGRPFYLACRDAAAVLGLGGNKPHVRAWRWLSMLCHVGILSKEKTGSMKARRANEYRYIPACRNPDDSD